MEEMIYVLDSSVFVQGYSELFADKAIVTNISVISEAKSPEAQIQQDILMRSGLRLIEAHLDSVQEIKAKSKDLSDNLSETDIQVAALALDFKKRKKNVVVVTEDNSLKNLCGLEGINTVSVKTGHIVRNIRWTRKCTGCGKKTDQPECPICGSETKYMSRKV